MYPGWRLGWYREGAIPGTNQASIFEAYLIKSGLILVKRPYEPINLKYSIETSLGPSLGPSLGTSLGLRISLRISLRTRPQSPQTGPEINL